MTDDKSRRAQAYAAMMSSEAWKELERYAEAECDLSMQRMDVKSASDLSLGEVCEERGLRNGMRKLIRHAEQCREGI